MKRVRKDEGKNSVRIKDKDGKMIMGSEKVNERWASYFERLLNVVDQREANVEGGANERNLVCERYDDKIV